MHQSDNTDPGDDGALPFIDEHTVRMDVAPDDAWTALGGMLARMGGTLSTLTARLLDTQPARRSGDPLIAGSTLPGFAVARAERPTKVVLRGRHRFSRYELTFRLEPDAGATSVHAETRAQFPGAAGRIYRMMVIGTGGHVVAVRGMLAGVIREGRGRSDTEKTRR